MKLKIVSNGTRTGTRIIDTETSVDITESLMVQRIQIDIDANKEGLAVATLTCFLPFDVVADATLAYEQPVHVAWESGNDG